MGASTYLDAGGPIWAMKEGGLQETRPPEARQALYEALGHKGTGYDESNQLVVYRWKWNQHDEIAPFSGYILYQRAML